MNQLKVRAIDLDTTIILKKKDVCINICFSHLKPPALTLTIVDDLCFVMRLTAVPCSIRYVVKISKLCTLG